MHLSVTAQLLCLVTIAFLPVPDINFLTFLLTYYYYYNYYYYYYHCHYQYQYHKQFSHLGLRRIFLI